MFISSSLHGVHEIRKTTCVFRGVRRGSRVAVLQLTERISLHADGDRAGVESTVLGKRRIQYEEELAYNPTNYDAWFSLARLEEDAYRADREDGQDAKPDRVREVYERAVANVPPASEKRFWRRYIVSRGSTGALGCY